MGKKINLGVLFGGQSVEHEVSLQSAKNVIRSLDREKYDLVLMAIDKEGKWHTLEEESYLIHAEDPQAIALGEKKDRVALVSQGEEKEMRSLTQPLSRPIDVVFPVLHGTFGEDGTIQGLLKLAGIPFVGASVLGSAIGMDKDVMKRLLRDAKIPVADFIVIQAHERHLWSFEKIAAHFPPPYFVKPANAGSSIGVSKVKTRAQFEPALEEAFQFDRKILIEKQIVGREIECSVLGNEYPTVSLPCEIIPHGEFHSYLSKYVDPDGADFIIPVELEPEELSKVQTMALHAYKVLCCEGMARVDLFLTPEGEVYVNEINTIPGLTSMSPYSKMWEATGLSYPKLVDRLIELALERFEKEKKLKTEIEIGDLWAKT